ncbi:hypothetical protein Q2T42_01655 [Leptolyngbya boryana CZ1]|uniref:DUF4402 domain-containing protein n=1 Tax=Leptolyngbya boryana CZ1 TaxID=3060204 RepID=A0AA97AWP6_LEPBY|nr:hypothetical protein [Leptolyngbya boryana]WNZ46541.1 hypothetical protein Q2T42_01655 [Leptolyngbya boryana CZ1]
MNSQLLLRSSFGTFCVFSLLACQSSFAQTSLQIRNNSMVIQSNGQTTLLNSSLQSNRQRTSVTLRSTALKQPCWLTVSIAKGQLGGQIKIGDKVIQSLKGSRTVVNLAPYLSRGTKTIDISGKYQPARGALRIEFSGAGTQVSQQASGTGTFNHSLIVSIR